MPVTAERSHEHVIAEGYMRRLALDWTADGSGNVSYPVEVNGTILRATFKPGTGADEPTANYNVTLNDQETVDVLQGAGATLSATAVKTVMPSYAARSVRKDGAKPDQKHPLDKLLRRRPNGLQNAFTFWRTLFFHAVHTANAYAQIERDGSFRPVALHLLLPEDVKPFRWRPDDASPWQQFYALLPSKTVLPSADVIHLQGLSHDGQAGMDPIALHEAVFQKAGMVQRFTVEFLRKGTLIAGAVEIPGAMDDDQIEQMRAILRKFRAAEGEEDVLILTGGGKLNNTTITPQESQLVEQVSATAKAIAQITGVPVEFLFETADAKYNNNVEIAGQYVVRYCLRPWLEQTESELTTKLLTEAEQDDEYTVRINPGALLRGSTKEQEEVVGNSIKNGVRTANEGRALLDLPPSDDPDANKLKMLGDTNPPKPPPAD